ncbi:MAG: hypothetical protein KGH55_01395 [Nanoarchaeota archaeon]|nr:hypothetical protein [Nanoarchaeota archaeon]
MQQIYTLLIGICVLLLGIPAGNFLARMNRDELEKGQIWFRTIIIICALGATASLIFGSDALFFSFLFFMIATSRSLKKEKK